jgi:hypothetical protein
MEHAGFESPLSDEQLKELGRLVVNCGFVEFLAGVHVGMLLKASPDARIDLINPLSTHRKTAILKQGLERIPKDETRKMVAEACELINAATKHRNTMLHGIWGLDSDKTDAKAIAVSTKERSGRLRADDITKCADELALASRKLADALLTDSGGKPAGKPEQLVIIS